jgi:hypothetical protein
VCPDRLFASDLPRETLTSSRYNGHRNEQAHGLGPSRARPSQVAPNRTIESGGIGPSSDQSKGDASHQRTCALARESFNRLLMRASREGHVMRIREAIFDGLSAAKNHRSKRKGAVRTM